MLRDKQRNAYAAFYASARHNETLDAKTTVMIHLASAMTTGCYP